VNFGDSAAFPLLLGGVVAVCGLAALTHLLVVSVARRRTETGLLLALGMVRRQLATIVFWQATTVAVVAITAGIPLGIAAGRAIGHCCACWRRTCCSSSPSTRCGSPCWCSRTTGAAP